MTEIQDTFRGGEDAEIFGVEGERYGEGVSPCLSPSHPTIGSMGEHPNLSSPRGVGGGAPAENGFCAFELNRTHL